jgi:hypothetical protein
MPPARPPLTAAQLRWRAAGAVVCVGLTSVLAALILGEYEFRGTLPFVAGPLFGLILGEVAVGVGRSRSPVVGGISAACGFGALVWAGWINSGEGLEPIHRMIWVAAALAAATAWLRIVGLRRTSPRRSAGADAEG